MNNKRRKINFIDKATGNKIAGSKSQGAVVSRETYIENGKTVVVENRHQFKILKASHDRMMEQYLLNNDNIAKHYKDAFAIEIAIDAKTNVKINFGGKICIRS